MIEEIRQWYEQQWRPTEAERKADELARRYHRETEAYDRTVCSGPIVNGAVQPIGRRELGLINRNAAEVRERILTEAAKHGTDRKTMLRAIRSCWGAYD